MDENRNMVQSVERTFVILEEIANSNSRLGLTELSERLKLHKSTIHRLVNTLITLGYVIQNPKSGTYSLGAKVFSLGKEWLNEHRAFTKIVFILEELMELTGETVYLVVRDYREGVYVDKVVSYERIKSDTEIGRRIPLHCTAVGKVLLSGLSLGMIETLYKNVKLDKYTERTITEFNELLLVIKEVKEKGYAVDNSEFEEKVKCVAAPVQNYKGDIIAAVSVSGPEFRIPEEKIEWLIESVKDKVLKASQVLGYFPDIKNS